MDASSQYVRTFFEALSRECDEQADRLLEKKASLTLDDFICNTMARWKLELEEFGYPAFYSESWLFQVLVGKLLLCYMNKLLHEEAKPLQMKISHGSSLYRRWESGNKKIFLSMNGWMDEIRYYVLPHRRLMLSEMPDNYVFPRRVDIAVIVDGWIEVYLYMKLYTNQPVDTIAHDYKGGLSPAYSIGKNVVKRLIFFNVFGERSAVPRTLEKEGIPPGEWICVKSRQGQLDKLFLEVEAKSKAWQVT